MQTAVGWSREYVVRLSAPSTRRVAMSDPSLALHTALLAAVKAAVSCDVWDAVPQGSDYPYVTLDSSISNTDEFLTLQSETRFYYLGIWSRNYGQAEVLSIMSQIRDALHEQPLSLSIGSVVSLRVERQRTVRESDNLTYMGQMTLRIITEH
jgi:hypothetical protein